MTVPDTAVLTDDEVVQVLKRAITDLGPLDESTLLTIVQWASKARVSALLLADVLSAEPVFRIASLSADGELAFAARELEMIA